ncbi:hypothetical protein ACFL20_05360 [Spirochaetota bacterium]
MDKETFSSPKVIRKLRRKFIPIRIDVESKKTILYKKNRISPKDFFILLGGRGLPMLVFTDKNGTFLASLPGFIQDDELIPVLNRVITFIKKSSKKK